MNIFILHNNLFRAKFVSETKQFNLLNVNRIRHYSILLAWEGNEK